MTYLEKREKIRQAVQEADKAFWEVIQKHFPEHQGKLSQHCKNAFEKEQKEVVADWLSRLSDEG